MDTDMVASLSAFRNRIGSNACNPKQTQQPLLTLSSGSVFQNQSHPSFLSSVNNTSFNASEAATIRPCNLPRYASSDPRYKRAMKNRESAVRSRARKQEFLFLHSPKLAYKKALEMKFAHLTEENSRLKKQVEELQFRLSSAKPPKMGALYRTTSSPY